MKVIEALVLAESVYKVEAKKSRDLLAMHANTVFEQSWMLPPENSDEQDDTPSTKKRKTLGNLDHHQLPDRATVGTYLSDFSLLSFKHMSQSIVKAKSENKTVTYGTDDTKAAGRKLHDIKTSHVTIMNEEREKETFTSGFHPNATHSSSYTAETVQHDLKEMAVLTNNTYRDILGMLDYFMTDPASDSDVMLEELGIEEGRRLKCNACVLLAVDVAVDKVFRDIETQLGVASLIGRGVSRVFNSPKNSI